LGIGEAWVTSGRDDHPGRVANAPLKGQTIRKSMKQFPDEFSIEHFCSEPSNRDLIV
jgi:hypothetical protein